MKKILSFSFILLLLLTAASPLRAEMTPEISTIASGSPVTVYYSFDHYANNPKMARSFVSEDMLNAAARSGALKSSVWDVSGVVSRLKSLLSLHTHSRSTTKKVRTDLEKVSNRSAYERLMHTRNNDIEVVVFCHRRKGKEIDELLVFRFRSDYCSRVIQLTGKMRPDDITTILKMTKKK